MQLVGSYPVKTIVLLLPASVDGMICAAVLTCAMLSQRVQCLVYWIQAACIRVLRRPWPADGESAGKTVRDIARQCEGFSGSDISQLAQAAAHLAMEDHTCVLAVLSQCRVTDSFCVVVLALPSTGPQEFPLKLPFRTCTPVFHRTLATPSACS